MKQFAWVAAAILLSGCAAKIISSNPRMVVVGAGTAHLDKAAEAAEVECSKYGRHARLNVPAAGSPRWVFDCVE